MSSERKKSTNFLRILLLLLLSGFLIFLVYWVVSDTQREVSLVEEHFRQHLEPLSTVEEVALLHAIILTKEFSFKLDPLKLIPRKLAIDQYLAVISPHLGDLAITDPREPGGSQPRPLSVDNGVWSIRREQAFERKKCGVAFITRSRKYLLGEDKGFQTIDIKKNFNADEFKLAAATITDDHRSGVAKQNELIKGQFFPAKKPFSTKVIQKLEEDVHVCSSKWSRETRHYQIPNNFTFQTCKDFHLLFPGLLLDTSNQDPSLIEIGYESYDVLWYVLSHRGKSKYHVPGADSEMEFSWESTFTLQFKGKQEDDIFLNENMMPTTKSEYSFRIFSTQQGHGPWLSGLREAILARFSELTRVLKVPEKECK